jgi:hypothetical protein
MKNRTRINYTFLLLAIGIVSTILSNPVLAQTEGNSQNQTGQTSGGQGQQQGGQGQQQGGQGQQQGGQGQGADSGGQMKTGDDIGSIEELQSLTREGPPTKTSNDTTPLMGDLGKETSTDQGFTGDKEQQGGQGQQQGGQGQQQGGQGQQGNQTAGQQQGGQGQQGNQTAGQQQGGQGQQGNQTGNPLSDIGEQIGNLFK